LGLLDVFHCFQNFHAYAKKVIRTDNGTEYVNIAFGAFLYHQGILHQTFFPDTPPQNGMAERKNRHILEVARSLMYTINAPKFFWGEAVL
jgi:transposase InsO family protein